MGSEGKEGKRSLWGCVALFLLVFSLLMASWDLLSVKFYSKIYPIFMEIAADLGII